MNKTVKELTAKLQAMIAEGNAERTQKGLPKIRLSDYLALEKVKTMIKSKNWFEEIPIHLNCYLKDIEATITTSYCSKLMAEELKIEHTELLRKIDTILPHLFGEDGEYALEESYGNVTYSLSQEEFDIVMKELD